MSSGQKHLLMTLATYLLWAFSLLSGVKPSISKDVELEPEFAEPIPNVTVSIGRDVKLACVVENLGTYRIAWIHTDRYTLLTLQNRVITRNPRFGITHNGHRTWTLHIMEVEERENGEYMCQINTSPMKSQSGFITVVEIPAPVTPPHYTDTFLPKSEKLWNSLSHNVASKPNEKDNIINVVQPDNIVTSSEDHTAVSVKNSFPNSASFLLSSWTLMATNTGVLLTLGLMAIRCH
ncbi:lachesin-like [Tachypleus tridentatus]|uniref:lachesin-like n=1 Tax=Tachypleus tridentatus TaxID=6853 RepID=UPI003FD54ED3